MPLISFSAGTTAVAADVNANFALCVLTDTARTITVTHTWSAAQTFAGITATTGSFSSTLAVTGATSLSNQLDFNQVGTSSAAFRILALLTSGDLAFRELTANQEAMRITAARALLVGTTTTTNASPGDARIEGAFWLKDGITAPTTTAGYTAIYVDTADGDLKVKFGDGTTKTISVDT